MPTEVIMPQMGESIFEGTLTKWLKKKGDAVQKDEPLFEISTDKVDAEIPAPAGGVLIEIKAEEGSTVKVNSVVGVIQEESGKAASVAADVPTPETPKPEAQQPTADTSKTSPPPAQSRPAAQSGPAAASSAPAAASNVVMPQMGESIFEGTITKWLKQPGDMVQKDEPLFEISTDKVDAEIPSPESGVLSEIKAPAGAVVQVNTVVAVIGGGTDKAIPAAGAPAPKQAAAKESKESVGPSAPAVAVPASSGNGTSAKSDEKVRSSPLVRRIAKEHNLDLRQVPATGLGGRITKEDVLGFVAQGGQIAPAAAQTPSAASEAPAPPASDQLVPMSKMRSIIAQRMVESKRTSAHVHTVFKIDMSRIVRIREKERAKYEQRNGVKLTYMPFLSRAVIATLRKMPLLNASLEGDSVRYHRNVNLGIAVALDWGLIVPVIKQAEELNFLGIARAIADLAARARSKKLKPEEVGAGTFTITNPGLFGEQFGTPIINQPELAILSVGGLFKEPTAVTDENGFDSIAIRSVIRLTLGFDHRIIDGAEASKFMAEVKKNLENWSEDIG